MSDQQPAGKTDKTGVQDTEKMTALFSNETHIHQETKKSYQKRSLWNEKKSQKTKVERETSVIRRTNAIKKLGPKPSTI